MSVNCEQQKQHHQLKPVYGCPTCFPGSTQRKNSWWFYFLSCCQFDFSLLVKTSRVMLKPYIYPQTGRTWPNCISSHFLKEGGTGNFDSLGPCTATRLPVGADHDFWCGKHSLGMHLGCCAYCFLFAVVKYLDPLCYRPPFCQAVHACDERSVYAT